ncbi:MAG: nucleotidyl transferase AbiEii/AbiGii toxin family protein [Patescibacteria group bacterium]
MTELIDPRQLLISVAKILARLKIPYLVTGGMAVFVWGRPRFTADVDIVIKLKLDDIDKLAENLRALSEASYIDKNSIKQALMRHGEFNFIDGLTGIKVDFWAVGETQFNKSQLERRIAKNILGQKVFFISPEDLILSKLPWHKQSESSRHLEDIESVFKIQKKLDLGYLRKWAKLQSTIKILESLIK